MRARLSCFRPKDLLSQANQRLEPDAAELPQVDSMKVFLTGATGFVGHHGGAALASHGADLRLLVRKSSNLQNLEGIGGDTVVGDLLEPESLKGAIAGCDAVMHVAADYRLWIRDPASMYRANVDGTRELLRLAREAARAACGVHVERCHNALRTDGLVINERHPRFRSPTWWGLTSGQKFLAERVAIEAAEAGQQVIILNPTTPIGPFDAKPTDGPHLR